MRKFFSLSFKWILFIIDTLALSTAIFSAGKINIGSFFFFTVQSNILVVICLFLSIFRPQDSRPRCLLRGITLTAITLTGFGYNFILYRIFIDWGGIGYTLPRTILHVTAPVGFILDWLLFGKHNQMRWKDILIWMIYPFLYFLLSIFAGLFFNITIYSFLRVSNGWGPLLKWLVVFFCFISIVGFAFVGIDKLMGIVHKQKPQNSGNNRIGANNMEKRIIATDIQNEDIEYEPKLRPSAFSEYIGQEKVKTNMKVYIEAAKMRGEPLDHVLLYGPPGLGKTTLSNIIAQEMSVNIKITSGPAIERPGDMAAILSDLGEGDILFIDEIHRLNRMIEEILYPAMEDFVMDIVIGKGPGAKAIRLNLARFTLIGATTRIGLLTAPLRDRFGVVHRLELYNIDELKTIIIRSAGVLSVEVSDEGASEIARRSRGTPRIANRLLKRVRDFAQVKYGGKITGEIAKASLDMLDVDKMGLDATDRRMLLSIIEKFSGGPVGVDTLAASINEDPETIEDVYEPYLIQLGYIQRTPRGRTVTAHAYEHFGIKAVPVEQLEL